VIIQGSPFLCGSTSPKPLLVSTGTSVVEITSSVLVFLPMELKKVVTLVSLISKSLDSSPSPVEQASSAVPPAHTTAAWALVTGEPSPGTNPGAAVAKAAHLSAPCSSPLPVL
jgi:hypothetical protein